MTDDEEALIFGRDIARDIVRAHDPTHAGSVMDIIEEKRPGGSIPFEMKP
jgi:hypothetical protein